MKRIFLTFLVALAPALAHAQNELVTLTGRLSTGQNYTYSFDAADNQAFNATVSSHALGFTNATYTLSGQVLETGVTGTFNLGSQANDGVNDSLVHLSLYGLTQANYPFQNTLNQSDLANSLISFKAGDYSFYTPSTVGGSYSGSLNVQAVPEPSTWAMVVVGGLGLAGVKVFRRRRTA